MPTISIIVPVYNSKNTIKRCIDSILSQSFSDFELILIDDGSIDKSAYICDEYKKSDNRVIVVHNTNHGVSFTRNTGLELAKGEYITFIDSDDYVEEDYLKNLFNPQFDFTVCGYTTVDNLGNVRSKNQYTSVFYKNTEQIDWFELFKGNMLHTPFAKLFKLDIIKKNNIIFDTHISCGEDTVFVVDYLSHINSLIVSEQINYFYVVSDNGNSLSTKLRPGILEEVAYSKEYCMGFIHKKYPAIFEKITDIYQKMIYWLCIGYLQSLLSSKTLNKSEKICILEDFLSNKYMQYIVNNPTRFLHETDPIAISLKKKQAKQIISKYNIICFKNNCLNWFSSTIFKYCPKFLKACLKKFNIKK